MFAHPKADSCQILGACDRVAAGSRAASTLYTTTGRWNPFEHELAGRLHVDHVLDLRVETLRDEDLCGRLVGEHRDAEFVTEPIAA